MKNFWLVWILFAQSAFGNVFPVKSLNPEDIRDLNPLEKIIGDAKMVGIGESAHGSQGFTKARHKLIMFLIKQLDFTNIILEAGYLNTKPINKVLNKCLNRIVSDEELSISMSEIHRFDKTKETRELLRSICQYSYQSQKPIQFAGLDIWTVPWQERDLIHKAVKRSQNPKLSDQFQIAYDHCWVWKANSWKEASEQDDYKYLEQNWRINPIHRIPCQAALYNIQRYLKDEPEALVAAENQLTYQIYRDLYVFERTKALNLREDQQAKHVLRFNSIHSGKTIVLAHNVHIAKDQFNVVPQYPGQWDNVRSLGEKLTARFGKDYKAIALTGYQVSNMDQAYPTPNKVNSLDYHLAQEGELILIDTNTSKLNLDKKWWMHWESFHNGAYLIPIDQYDAIFFIKHSPAATPLLKLN